MCREVHSLMSRIITKIYTIRLNNYTVDVIWCVFVVFWYLLLHFVPFVTFVLFWEFLQLQAVLQACKCTIMYGTPQTCMYGVILRRSGIGLISVWHYIDKNRSSVYYIQYSMLWTVLKFGY